MAATKDLIREFTENVYTALEAEKIDPNSELGKAYLSQAISLAGQLQEMPPIPRTEALSPFLIRTLIYALGLQK